jgi:DNA modification methylase
MGTNHKCVKGVELVRNGELPFVVLRGEARRWLAEVPENCVQCTITSPPYYRQKDYGVRAQAGWERTPAEYVDRLNGILVELLRVTTPIGSCFVVIGDTYSAKTLQLIPQRLVIAAQECGWTVRNDLIWLKSDAAPDGAFDRWRLTHEHVLFLTKSPRGYKFRANEVRVPYSPVTERRWGHGQRYGGRKARVVAGPRGQRFRLNKTFRLSNHGAMPRDVFELPTARSKLDHYATFPMELVERLIRVSSDEGDVVLDPFCGTGTTGIASIRLNRRFVGIELNARYAKIAQMQLRDEPQAAKSHV